MSVVSELQAKFTASATQMQSTIHALRQEVEDLGSTTEKNNNRSGASTGKQVTAWERLSSKLTDVQKRYGAVQDAGGKMAKVFGIATAAVGGSLVATTKSAMDFESQMSGVKSVMAPDEVRKYGKSLEELAIVQGAKTAYSATQCAQAEEELVKAGVSVRDIIHGGLSGALNLATAGELDLKDAAEIASTALNAFKKDGLSVAQAADILAGAANASATDVGELKYSLSMSSAVAAGVGLTFKDTATALAVFAQNGLKGSDAGTSLKTMLMRLEPQTDKAAGMFEKLGLMTFDASKAAEVLSSHGVKPLSKSQGDLIKQLTQLSVKMSGAKEGSKKQQKAFKELTEGSGAMHSAFYDNNGDLKDMSQIAQLLQKHMKNLTNEQRQNALGVMFGSDAVRGAGILYREGAKGVDAMAASMSKIKAADVAKQKLNNMKGTIEQLRGSIETAGITIGESLIPTLQALTKKVQGAVDWFNNLSPAMQQTIVKSAVTTTAILGVVTGIGALTWAIAGSVKSTAGAIQAGGKFIKYLQDLKKTAGAAGAAGGLAQTASKVGGLAGVLPMLTNPITLTIAALAALGIGAGVVWHQMNKIQSTSTEAADAIGEQRSEITPLIDQYDDLKLKSTLTSDEFGRFIDIQARLKKATSADEIKRLKDEADKLQNKSSLSNKELDEMVRLNGDLVKTVPGATDKITKQGNRIAESIDKAKKYNDALFEQQIRQLEIARNNAKGNEAKYKREINDLQDKLNAGLGVERHYQDLNTEATQNGWKATIKKYERQRDNVHATEQEKAVAINNLAILRDHGVTLSKNLGKQQAINDKTQDKINKDKEQLNRADELNKKLATTILKANGIDSTGKSVLNNLAGQVEKQQQQLSKLDQMHASGKITNAQYNQGKEAIQGQIEKLMGVGSKIKSATNGAYDLNKELGKNIKKDVNAKTHTDSKYDQLPKSVKKKIDVDTWIDKTYASLGATLVKNIKIVTKGGVPVNGAYANGTDDHPGGPAILGDGGKEEPYMLPDGTLGVSPDTPTLFSWLPKGTKVWSSIQKFMDQLPHYVNGTRGLIDGLSDRLNGMMQLRMPSITPQAVAMPSARFSLPAVEKQTSPVMPNVNVYVTGDNYFEYETDEDQFSQNIAQKAAAQLYREGKRP